MSDIKAASPAECKTLSIEEAGKLYFNLSRNGSYAAAKAGTIPTILISKTRMRVPVAAMERKLQSVE
jgi:hypothetical protein